VSDETTIPTEETEPGAPIEPDCSCRPPDVFIPETDHSSEWGDQKCIPFFPDHFLSEATGMVLLLCVYSTLAILWPAGLEAPANPLVTPVGIKPEWYFLFLYSFLHFVPVLVGVLTPLVGIVFLILLPWIDRNPSRKPSKRPIAIGISILLLVGIVALTIIGLVD
jgi:cytochrome b6-f complex subunit 4